MSSNSGWPETTPESAPLPVSVQSPVSKDPSENPPWNGGDVALIGLLMFVVPYLLMPFVVLIAEMFLYRGMPFLAVAKKPWIVLSTQFVWFGIIAVYMIAFVQGRFHQSFWEAIRWNWPRRNWLTMVLVGAALSGLQVLERFVPLPQHPPIEDILSTAYAQVIFGVLAISFGPLMEELFFRGFLYPVVTRRFGMVIGVIATSAGFGLIHGAQLGFAWGLVFIIFLVGVVLTIVRAKTHSVGASFLVHVAYNSSVLVWGILQTRHLDKIVH